MATAVRAFNRINCVFAEAGGSCTNFASIKASTQLLCDDDRHCPICGYSRQQKQTSTIDTDMQASSSLFYDHAYVTRLMSSESFFTVVP